MKKMNKKGFTITELVIVIAVIAILAGVMIPTFGGIIKTAQESAEMQRVAAAYKEAYALAFADGAITDGEKNTEAIDGFTFTFAVSDDGTVTSVSVTVATQTNFAYSYDVATNKWTVTKGGTATLTPVTGDTGTGDAGTGDAGTGSDS